MKKNHTFTVIEGQQMTKRYHMGGMDLTVLHNISLHIASGDFVSIMGPSGSGKSTLLYLLSGLDDPTEGKVLIKGRDLSQLNDGQKSMMRRRDIGFVFQFYNLIPNLTVEENILLPVMLDQKERKAYADQLDDLLHIVGLSDRRRHRPRELSGGQQQRVAIARALIHEPEIIFADEPTGNLDSKAGKEIMELLCKVNGERGKTIVMVTHGEESAAYCSRMIKVKDGRLDSD